MQSGIVFLSTLIDFAEQDISCEALYGSSPRGKEYARKAKKVVEEIENERGFYLWGRYQKNRLWENIYLGKAGFGKTAHLQSRILEELKDERCFLYEPTLADEEKKMQIMDVITAKIKQRSKEAALLKKNGKTAAEIGEHVDRVWANYQKQWAVSVLKGGTSHIIWVATPELDLSQVHNVEADLIETLNPTANIKRPAPPSTLQNFTKEVIGHFRQEIHEHRPRRTYGKRF